MNVQWNKLVYDDCELHHADTFQLLVKSLSVSTRKKCICSRSKFNCVEGKMFIYIYMYVCIHTYIQTCVSICLNAFVTFLAREHALPCSPLSPMHAQHSFPRSFLFSIYTARARKNNLFCDMWIVDSWHLAQQYVDDSCIAKCRWFKRIHMSSSVCSNSWRIHILIVYYIYPHLNCHEWIDTYDDMSMIHFWLDLELLICYESTCKSTCVWKDKRMYMCLSTFASVLYPPLLYLSLPLLLWYGKYVHIKLCFCGLGLLLRGKQQNICVREKQKKETRKRISKSKTENKRERDKGK